MLEIVNTLGAAWIQPGAWKMISVPLMGGAVGWLTVWLALRLSLAPLPVGPHRHGIDTLARRALDRALGEHLAPEQLLLWMEPEKVAAYLADQTRPRIEEYVDDVMMAHNAGFWEPLPLSVRQRVYRRARRALPVAMERLVDDIAAHLASLPDIRHLFAQRLADEPELATRWFRQISTPIWRRLPLWAFVGGAVIGLVLIPVLLPMSLLLPLHWLLPACGVLAGLLGYRLAVWRLFAPATGLSGEPPGARRTGFLRYRREAAAAGAQLASEHLLTLRYLLEPMISGAYRDRWRALVVRRFRPLLGGVAVRAVVRRRGGLRATLLGDKAMMLAAEALTDERFSHERHRLLVPHLAGCLETLEAGEFQALLRPLFRRVGMMALPLAVLIGTVAGVANGLLLFGAP